MASPNVCHICAETYESRPEKSTELANFSILAITFYILPLLLIFEINLIDSE